MKRILYLTLCSMLAGCGQKSPQSANTISTPDTTFTANRPVNPDPADTAAERLDPANTGVNIRDRDGGKKTPFDQNENAADIAMTAEIRSRVVDTKMSVNAQNVKIITQNNKVTLRGPVATADEKRSIEVIAASVAGPGNVESQLEVTP